MGEDKKKMGSLSERFTNRNLIIFFALAAAACVAIIAFSSRTSGDNCTAVVRKNGEVLYEIDLNKVKEPYKIDTDGNVLLVEKGQISVMSADCPDGLCVKQGKISNSSQTIACLPNRLTITIESDDIKPETDAVVK